MLKFLTTCFLLCAATFVFSQEQLSIAAFTPLPNDMTARTLALERDDQGNLRALRIASHTETNSEIEFGTTLEIVQTPIQNLSTSDASDFDLEMVFVEGGRFKMGCRREEMGDCFEELLPAHYVTVSDFYIGKYEVTQAQWRAVMGNNPSHFIGCDDCPVEKVSWNEVQDFIQKLNQLSGKNYRLPTEAEWEYAARGGNKSQGFLHAGGNDLDSLGWYASNSTMRTNVVGQWYGNQLGIYDMSGNVSEWCEDWYGEYPNEEQINPKGPLNGERRVLRGGSWNDTWGRCVVAARDNGGSTIRLMFNGFRLVLPAE